MMMVVGVTEAYSGASQSKLNGLVWGFFDSHLAVSLQQMNWDNCQNRFAMMTAL